MSYPKQPGQDAQAHRDLAVRHLEAVQLREELRQRVAKSEEALRYAAALIQTAYGENLPSSSPNEARFWTLYRELGLSAPHLNKAPR